MEREVYLGDGCYASFDGWEIWLRAPREGGDHIIALEPPTLRALMDFAKTVPANAPPVAHQTEDMKMDEFDLVKRAHLYESVWNSVGKIAKTAAPGSITPETFSRMAVDVVLSELLKAGAIVPAFHK